MIWLHWGNVLGSEIDKRIIPTGVKWNNNPTSMGEWDNPCCPFTRNPPTAVQKTSFHLQRPDEVGKNKNVCVQWESFWVVLKQTKSYRKTSNTSPNAFACISLVGIDWLKYKNQNFLFASENRKTDQIVSMFDLVAQWIVSCISTN